MKTGILEFAAAVALLAGCVAPDAAERGELALWRDGSEAKNALVEYVAAAVDPDSPGYIPPEERIAVFDFDGTLFCETAPTYFDWMLFEHRVLDDESYRAAGKQKATALAARTTGKRPGLDIEFQRMMAEAWKGVSPEELGEIVREFAEGPQPGFSGMKRKEAFYRPMVEVVEFLRSRGFLVYVCSGTERFMLRAVAGEGLSLPPRQIIGSDYALAASAQGGRDGLDFAYGTNDVLVLGGSLVVKNLHMNKVVAMAREIGERPVLAFGNSFSDSSMLDYVLQNKRRRSMAFMVLCDDTVREYGNLPKAEKIRKACAANGWFPISMRDDWTTIYGPGVKRTPPAGESGE